MRRDTDAPGCASYFPGERDGCHASRLGSAPSRGGTPHPPIHPHRAHRACQDSTRPRRRKSTLVREYPCPSGCLQTVSRDSAVHLASRAIGVWLALAALACGGLTEEPKDDVLTESEFEAAFATGYCAWAERHCDAVGLELREERCPGSLPFFERSSRTPFDPDAAEACLFDQERAEGHESPWPRSCLDVYPATQAIGEACDATFECLDARLIDTGTSISRIRCIEGVCAQEAVTVAEPGVVCSGAGDDQSLFLENWEMDAICDLRAGLACIDLRCAEGSREGESCEPGTCVFGTVCGASGVCERMLSLGDACEDGLGKCRAPAACAVGVCVLPTDHGAECTSGKECKSLGCRDGQCRSLITDGLCDIESE